MIPDLRLEIYDVWSSQSQNTCLTPSLFFPFYCTARQWSPMVSVQPIHSFVPAQLLETLQDQPWLVEAPSSAVAVPVCRVYMMSIHDVHPHGPFTSTHWFPPMLHPYSFFTCIPLLEPYNEASSSDRLTKCWATACPHHIASLAALRWWSDWSTWLRNQHSPPLWTSRLPCELEGCCLCSSGSCSESVLTLECVGMDSGFTGMAMQKAETDSKKWSPHWKRILHQSQLIAINYRDWENWLKPRLSHQSRTRNPLSSHFSWVQRVDHLARENTGTMTWICERNSASS